MVVIVDYGVGNLFSIISSFRAIGVEAVATGDAEMEYPEMVSRAAVKSEALVLAMLEAMED